MQSHVLRRDKSKFTDRKIGLKDSNLAALKDSNLAAFKIQTNIYSMLLTVH